MAAAVSRTDLDPWFDMAAQASTDVACEREFVLLVIRRLEERLREAVAGDALRGMRNIAGPHGDLRAALVTAPGSRFGVDTFVPYRRTALAVHRDGSLIVAWIEDGVARWRHAEDADLRVEQLEDVARTVHAVLVRHVEHAGRTAEALRPLADLAGRIASALE